MIPVYCMLVAIISVFTASFIIFIKEPRKDLENIAKTVTIGLGLVGFIGLTVFVAIFHYQLANAEVYTTDDFTFVYSTESTTKHVKFVDAYNRRHNLDFSGASTILGGASAFEVKDENLLRYKLLANKEKTCIIEYVCITKDVADAVECPYEKTLEASTTTKGD